MWDTVGSEKCGILLGVRNVGYCLPLIIGLV